MTESSISLVIEHSIARLTLKRSHKRNALTRQMIAEMNEAVETVAADETARLLILSAEGTVFCAGMDLGEMQDRASCRNPEEEWQKDTECYHDLLVGLFELPMPTMSVVQGPVLAGGVGLILACDIVLAAESAWFSLPEPRRGITAAVVAPLLLYRVGAGAAHYLLLSGQQVTASEALRLGLFHQTATTDQLAVQADELTAVVLESASSALAITKQHLRECATAGLADQFQRGLIYSADARRTPDAREGVAAFLEQRPPTWSPRAHGGSVFHNG